MDRTRHPIVLGRGPWFLERRARVPSRLELHSSRRVPLHLPPLVQRPDSPALAVTIAVVAVAAVVAAVAARAEATIAHAAEEKEREAQSIRKRCRRAFRAR